LLNLFLKHLDKTGMLCYTIYYIIYYIYIIILLLYYILYNLYARTRAHVRAKRYDHPAYMRGPSRAGNSI
jgi:hypothetical protein